MKPYELLSIISKEYQEILGDKLCGIYVHGSLAFACFCWSKSDIDFLVVVYEEPTQAQKELLIRSLLDLHVMAPPKGFEMSVVLSQDCKEFKYPTPFQLHFSNAHINKARQNLAEYCRSMKGTDCDLAAHFTVIKEVGIVQYGKPIHEVFGVVPREYYMASIKSDIADVDKEIESNPLYYILNLCRIYAYLKEGLILSKMEGGIWGKAHLSPQYSGLIQDALDCYGAVKECHFDVSLAKQFAHDIISNSF